VRFSASTFSAPYLHQFSAVAQNMHFFGAIWDKFVLNLVLIQHQILKIYA
jgi:hypothetical protein